MNAGKKEKKIRSIINLENSIENSIENQIVADKLINFQNYLENLLFPYNKNCKKK